MADDAPTPTTASTPNPRDHNSLDALDAAHIADLLAALERIPRDELPDGDARAHLAECIREGLIDNVYRPLGCDWHNVTWTTRQPWIDPRQRIADFLAGFTSYTEWARAHNVTPVTPQEASQDADGGTR